MISPSRVLDLITRKRSALVIGDLRKVMGLEEQDAGLRDLVAASAMGRTVRSMVELDRVRERRRAVVLARHYRDEKSLAIAEIAQRLGRAPATVKAYLYDPS